MSELATMIRDLGNNFNAKAEDLGTRLGELEKRAAREREYDNDNFDAGNSLAASLVASDTFKQLNGGVNRGRAQVEMAAITSANPTVGTGRSASTSLVPAQRIAGIVTQPDRALTVRDLIAPGKTTAGSIEFVQETGFTNNAAMVAETTQKPYSDITFNMKTAPVRTLAHLFKISIQMLQDAEGLISYLDLRGTTGLKLKEENQILFGDGTGQNLLGLMGQASIFSPAFVPQDATAIDRLRLAALQVRKAEYRADGIMMHPDDLAALELTKDNEGRYILGNPAGEQTARVWRLPIAETTAMPTGTFLIGAFSTAAQLFDRQQVTFEISTENSNDFELNMATARIEERLALAVYRPEALVAGQF
ncbi:phage major capsid protein [Rhizobiaceae bacterium CRRU44]|uniref:Phage major capsid protein n=1 Tax=Ferranicluibacter rubi TaxID=2715133 RepID=A0AA43ZC27_9HYPH|nr:phage major capsid protein [Ferranicluibacter rubi]NHT75087.1 phage major capsid protein [Ferranicluibacter rubi]